MDISKNTKILIGILVILIISAGGWWVWNSQMENINCSNIISADAINKCIGKKIEVIGTLECEKQEIPTKAGVHYLKFEDGDEIKFLQEYPNCKEYNLKKVKVVGELYQCRPREQCEGIGLTNIESVSLLEEMVREEEKLNEVFIEHRWGGFGGESQEWKRIYQKEDTWIIENCERYRSVRAPKEEKILCCEIGITKEEVEKLLKAVKNTDISQSPLPPTDVFSSYEILINTSQREIWIESSGRLGEEVWNVISQSSNKRELFKMSGEKMLEEISNLPSCEKKKERKEIEWQISQPPSLLTKYLPSELEELVPVQNETFSFPAIRIFDKEAEDFGIVDFFTKKWLKKETPSEQVIVPDVEISILAFRDKESFERFPILSISFPAGSTPTTVKTESVEIKGIKGFKYILYGPKPKELTEPFDVGDVTLFVLAKDNLLFRIRGNQNLKTGNSTANAELLIKNLKLEEKPPLYIWEDQKIEFKGILDKEEIFADVEKCLNLSRRVEIFMCIEKTAQITGDAKVCDIYKKPEFKDIEPTFIETCYIFAAVGREDPSVCDKLKTYTKEQCLGVYNRELTKAKNDPAQCGGNAECLEYFVEITGDLKFCDMISDKFAREWCYRDHAVTVEQCDEIYKIGGPNNPSRDYCIERLAIQNRDLLLCEKIDDSYNLGEIIKNRCKRNF